MNLLVLSSDIVFLSPASAFLCRSRVFSRAPASSTGAELPSGLPMCIGAGKAISSRASANFVDSEHLIVEPRAGVKATSVDVLAMEAMR